MEHAFTNELIHENSPYLLQHAHNPVEWHAWSETALQKAKDLDKPILVSIGYAACHWCHVMEKESFENVEVATYMNENFINIKIDREERPDLDHIYMDAVQAISGSGGWPLNVFLTTDGKPFYGGTYFPPEKAFNRPSWKDVLSFIKDVWQTKRDEIEKQADTLLDHVNNSNRISAIDPLVSLTDETKTFNADHCTAIRNNILKSADKTYGGFGNAPKFPHTFTLQLLLNYGFHFNDEMSIRHSLLSLNKMLHGGIYDQLAGGMSRYSTDVHWLVPHFEKMLYDNALLIKVLCDAYQVSGDEIYKLYTQKTINFLLNEMKDPQGGFYAALDADSEGVEGLFYVWDKDEIDAILGADADIFCKWYGVTEAGNWEEKNILHISESKEQFAEKNQIKISKLNTVLSRSEEKLLAVRSKRIRPSTDDKIILGWNALLLTAFCKAYAAFGDEMYKENAVSLASFLIKNFSETDEIVYHTHKNGVSKHPAYLDDYAYLIQASIQLQEITSDQRYLETAKKNTTYVIDHFLNKDSGLFYYTNDQQSDIVTRKVELYDSAVPSGNSIMAENLFTLSILFDNRDWWKMAYGMIVNISDLIVKYPTSFSVWGNVIVNQVLGRPEIAITGKNAENLRDDVLKIYLPAKVLQSSTQEFDFPLLKNKNYDQEGLIYLCRDYQCSAPVSNAKEMTKLLTPPIK